MEKQNNVKKQVNISSVLVIGVFTCLLSSAVTGISVYLWRESVNKEQVARLDEKITSIEKKLNSNQKDGSADIIKDSNGIENNVDHKKLINTDNWNTYTSEEFGFRLRYPDDYIVEEHLPTHIIFRLKDVKNFDYPFDVLEFSRSQSFLGDYMDQSLTLAPVTIEGVLYPFKTYVTGEGSAMGTSSTTRHVINLKPDLMLMISDVYWEQRKYPDNCEPSIDYDNDKDPFVGIDKTTGKRDERCKSTIVSSFEVPRKYIELTRQVVETIEIL